MHFNDDWLKRWEEIVDQVDKDHVPVECLKKVVFKTTSRHQKTINLRRLKDQGFDLDDIAKMVDKYIQDNSDQIANMEFVLDIEEVAKLLQPETDKLLKKMK
jgi:hypothetical protein